MTRDKLKMQRSPTGKFEQAHKKQEARTIFSDRPGFPAMLFLLARVKSTYCSGARSVPNGAAHRRGLSASAGASGSTGPCPDFGGICG